MNKINNNIPKEVVIGNLYTTSWVNNPKIKWKLIGVSNQGQATLETIKTKKQCTTHVHNLRLITT